MKLSPPSTRFRVICHSELGGTKWVHDSLADEEQRSAEEIAVELLLMTVMFPFMRYCIVETVPKIRKKSKP